MKDDEKEGKELSREQESTLLACPQKRGGEPERQVLFATGLKKARAEGKKMSR